MSELDDVIAGLSPEQLVERAKACALEVEYWRQILGDCEAVNDAVLEGTNAVLDGTVAALSLMPLCPPAALELLERIVGMQRDALRAYKAIADRLDGTIELAAGRAKSLEPVADALLRAAGVEPGDSDEPPAT